MIEALTLKLNLVFNQKGNLTETTWLIVRKDEKN